MTLTQLTSQVRRSPSLFRASEILQSKGFKITSTGVGRCIVLTVTHPRYGAHQLFLPVRKNGKGLDETLRNGLVITCHIMSKKM